MVHAYNPETDTWTRKANLPIGRRNIAAAVVGDKIYVFGGHLGYVEEYDPAADKWTQKSDSPLSSVN